MRTYVMSWGTSAYGRVHVPFDSVAGFRRGLDLAEADAQVSGCVYEVDLWDTEIRFGHPLMVQFLVGDPTRSRVLVHDDGVARYVVGGLPESGEPLVYERPGGPGTAELETTNVAAEEACRIVLDYTRTGDVPDGVDWMELSMD